MKKLISITMLFLITVQMFGQNFKFVNAEKLNIREHAGKKYNVIEQASKGDKVILISESGKWAEIETENGIKGYVSAKYLSAKNESETKDEYAWLNVLIALIFLGSLGYKIISFFSRLFSKKPSSSRSKSSSREIIRKPKEVILKWYHCERCNEKIKAINKPTSINCSNANFHNWTDLGIVGDHAYNCENCGTTVYTKSKPTSFRCPQANFHHWTKLS